MLNKKFIAGILFNLILNTTVFSQTVSNDKLWTTYLYGSVTINGKAIKRSFKTQVTQSLIIKTGQFSYYECQISDNIGILVKENTSLKLIPGTNTIEIEINKGEVLFKVAHLKYPLKIKSDQGIILASQAEFKVHCNKNKMVALVRTETVSVKSNDGKTVELDQWNKVVIEKESLGSVTKITDAEKACLNDLKDLRFYSEAELEKQIDQEG